MLGESIRCVGGEDITGNDTYFSLPATVLGLCAGAIICRNNVICGAGCEADILAFINPFRYCGYFYDFETGFYFLSTRYYNPEIGRFVNAGDSENMCVDEINGLNLYAYCASDSVNRIDPLAAVVITAGGLPAIASAIESLADGYDFI